MVDKMKDGYYSLIQYCPEPRRMEFVNIGLILVCPALSFLGGMVVGHNNRIKRFFGDSHDWEEIDSLKLQIQEAIEALKSGEKLLANLKDINWSDQIQFSQAQSTPVWNPERNLMQLFLEIVL